MRISEVATQSGLSIATIRYYERSGLCPSVLRGTDGIRDFTPEIRDWLVLLASLRNTGMPMQDMRHFASLYQQGDATIAQRKAALIAHSDRLEDRQATLDACRDLLAYKLTRYTEILEEKT